MPTDSEKFMHFNVYIYIYIYIYAFNYKIFVCCLLII